MGGGRGRRSLRKRGGLWRGRRERLVRRRIVPLEGAPLMREKRGMMMKFMKREREKVGIKELGEMILRSCIRWGVVGWEDCTRWVVVGQIDVLSNY